MQEDSYDLDEQEICTDPNDNRSCALCGGTDTYLREDTDEDTGYHSVILWCRTCNREGE